MNCNNLEINVVVAEMHDSTLLVIQTILIKAIFYKKKLGLKVPPFQNI
jgi:hypothetical protein